MNSINWDDVASKIRSRNFGDIGDDVWSQIADKIEPKKRGRKPRENPEYNEGWSLENIHSTDKQHIDIVSKYERLRLNNVRSKKAFELIAANLDASGKPDPNGLKVLMTAGNVERIVYAWIKMEKELNEMMNEEIRLEKLN